MTRRADIDRARASLERAGYTVTPGVYIPARPVAPRSPAPRHRRSGMAALIYLVIVAGIIGGIVFGIQINAGMPMAPPDQLVPVTPASTQSPETTAPVQESAVPGSVSNLPRHNVVIIPPDFSIPWGTFLT